MLAGLAALSLAAGAVVPSPQANRVSEENARRIREGITRAELYAILGPPGDYSTGPTNFKIDPWAHPPSGVFWGDRAECGFDHSEETWTSDTLYVEIYYDPAGKPMGSYITPLERQPQSMLDNLLWRAKRRWQRWFP